MTTDELIRNLRICVNGKACRECELLPIDDCEETLMREAADRLEELEERVAIMSEGNQITMDEMIRGESQDA